jgi:hypothetical protein
MEHPVAKSYLVVRAKKVFGCARAASTKIGTKNSTKDSTETKQAGPIFSSSFFLIPGQKKAIKY